MSQNSHWIGQVCRGVAVGLLLVAGCNRTADEPAAVNVALDAQPVADVAADADSDRAKQEARVTAVARDINALAADKLRELKVGEEAIILVRGDAHGGTIYGSGPYTHDSRLSRAVVHAGALQHGELGLVRVRVFQHDGDHPRIEKNGIRPHGWGKYHASYSVERYEVPEEGEEAGS